MLRLLEERGYAPSVLTPEQLPLSELLRRLGEASLLVVVHGAGTVDGGLVTCSSVTCRVLASSL